MDAKDGKDPKVGPKSEPERRTENPGPTGERSTKGSPPTGGGAGGPGGNGGPGGSGGNGGNDGKGGSGGNGAGRSERAFTFPVLVESIAPAGSGGVMTTGAPARGADIGAQVTSALRDVLGWQPRGGDGKGFVGALTQSFDLREVEGHVEATWRERRFAVQSDLAGGISGAQASLLRRARRAVEEALPILDALYPLVVDADPQDVDAVRAIIASQLNELVGELAIVGGPRVARVDQIFVLLLGADEAQSNPDLIQGTLGQLRDLLGLSSTSDLVNTVDEEQNLTNFRVLADYAIGLRQSWFDNRNFFSRRRDGSATTFFGTQLVLLSRQLAVVSESVAELRSVLSSVFIGALERQTLEIVPTGAVDEPFFLEELLGWIEAFATREGPQLIQTGGKLGVTRAFRPTAERLKGLVRGSRHPVNHGEIPDGYFTERVQRALDELELHLASLVRLAALITHQTSAARGDAAAAADE